MEWQYCFRLQSDPNEQKLRNLPELRRALDAWFANVKIPHCHIETDRLGMTVSFSHPSLLRLSEFFREKLIQVAGNGYDVVYPDQVTVV